MLNHRIRFPLAAALFCIAIATLPAETDYSKRVRIATVNAGIYSSEYADDAYGIKLSGSGVMLGAYAQWIEHGKFQANAFAYYVPDVNDSRVAGLHLNADGYFLANALGCFVAGIDAERISIDMDAGDSIAGLDDFAMENDITVAIARAGFRFTGKPSTNLSVSLLPYAGVALEKVDGELTLDPAGPPAMTPPMAIDISDNSAYPVWGVNLTLRVFHAFELTGKYLARECEGERLDTLTAQVNAYLPLHFVASYQYKLMDETSGTSSYHLFGIGAAF